MGAAVKPSLDSLFSTEGTVSEISEMPFDEMKDLTEHRFEMYTGRRLQNMIDSIRRNGIMQPLLLWRHEGEYYLLSGYNRRNAGRLAGLDRGPARIFEGLSRADAISIMIETNLYQRSFSEMNPMEKAYCLAEHHNTIKCQGKRSDYLHSIPEFTDIMATSSDNQTKLRADGSVGNEYSLSRDKASKYIRIGSSTLAESLQELFSKSKLPLTQMYHLSYLDAALQAVAAEVLISRKGKISPATTKRIKESYRLGELTEESLRSALADIGSAPPTYAIPKAVSKYFVGKPKKEIDQIIKEAIEQYFAGRQ